MINPVEWAEQEFGAQAVFNRFDQVSQELNEVLRIKDAYARELRDLTWERDEREAAIAAKVLAGFMGDVKPPSDAAVGRRTKAEIGEDELCKSLSIKILGVRESLDKADSRAEALKVEARGLNARSEVIAAQLAFLTACKNAETVQRNLLHGNPGSRWPV